MRTVWLGIAWVSLTACSSNVATDADVATPNDAVVDTPRIDTPIDTPNRPDDGLPIADSGIDTPVSPTDTPPVDVVSDAADPPGTWRSALFPRGWNPLHRGGRRDSMGRILPDFSTAGWHRGEARPPVGMGTPRATVDRALGDGTTDATSGIQRAIDAACTAGGGVVLLPAGTYRVRLPTSMATTVLNIRCSRLVLRGEGPTRSRILFDDPLRARGVSVISVRGAGSVRDGSGTMTVALAADVMAESNVLSLATAPPFAVGDRVVVRNENTDAFRADYRMDAATSGLADLWPVANFWGLWYTRRIAAISGSMVTLDAPVHQTLRTRDRARVYALSRQLDEVGLESFGLGMVENPTTPTRAEPTSDDDYTMTGTTGYQVHGSSVIVMESVHDAWIHDVDSFAPTGNTTGAHVLSNGILLEEGASRITVSNCDLARPQYRGGGGNGYLFHIQGHEHLLIDSTADRARHGFIFNHASSGNVLRRLRTANSRYSDDSHRFLANANLYDNVTVNNGWLQAVNRGTTSSGAGFTSTLHVFWNTHVERNPSSTMGCAIESAQWGWGYLIGSTAAMGSMALLCPRSFTNREWSMLDQGNPVDFVEGEGMGASLWPGSLHAAQLELRCASEGIACVTW